MLAARSARALDDDGSTEATLDFDTDTDTEFPDGAPAESDLQRLGGLGSTYAERLQSAGYESIAALAEADPVAVAEAAAVAPGRGRRWVDAAGRMTATPEEHPGSGAAADETAGDDADGVEDSRE